MNCVRAHDEVEASDALLPDETLRAEAAEEVRNRRAAAEYLRAAAMTDDAVARELLRWRGAQLLLGRAKRSGGRPS